MLNWIWAGMILLGVLFAAFTGGLGGLTAVVTDAAKEAATLCITMTGVLALWSGLTEIAKEGGLLKAAAKKLRPLILFFFPAVREDTEAIDAISANFIANLFGLGNAALPAGLKAMRILQRHNPNPAVASDEMCAFLIINVSSLQLIPVNLIAYRSQYGSVNPGLIAAPALVATFVSTLAAVAFLLLMRRRRRSV